MSYTINKRNVFTCCLQRPEIEGDHNSLIELKVAKGDVGKVIGKDGRTAQSIRTILTAASTKLGRRAHLDIVD